MPGVEMRQLNLVMLPRLTDRTDLTRKKRHVVKKAEGAVSSN